MICELSPEIIDKALQEFVKPRMHTNESYGKLRADLNAALNAVTRDIKAEALRDAANVLSEYEPKSPTPTYDAMCVNWLLERAEKIENGEL